MAEQVVSIASGATSANVDVLQLFSFLLQQNVVRQVMVTGDPTNPLGFTAVLNIAPTGAEYADTVRVSPGSPDFVELNRLLSAILAELQNLVTVQGGLPLSSPALLS
jgi:hypothetical protein